MQRTSRSWQRAVFLVTAAAVTASCGGTAPEPASPEPAPVEPAPSPPPAAESSDAPAGEAKPSPEPAAEQPASDAPVLEAEPPRDIRYVMTPDGLRVEILGIKFFPKAETIKTPSGIGVRLSLEATASEARSLLAPERGPLAFAGSIRRKGRAEPETFGDERTGEGELVLEPGKPTKIVREWPGKNKGGALGNGDVLELDVGLWGLGSSAAERRPVKQFLRVTVKVEKWKGRARVEPPPSAKGQG